MLPSLDSGGVERGTLELGRYLAKNGHRSLVISAGGRLVHQLEEEGSSHFRWPVGEKSPRCLQYLVPLRRFLLQEEVDILHLRSRLPAWIGYLAWKSLPAGKRPHLVTTFHGFYSVNLYSGVMAKGEKVIAVSRAIADHIREHYGVGDDRLELVYRGVDAAQFSPRAVSERRVEALRTKWHLPAGTDIPLILLPARLTSLKGHDVFFRALAMLQESNWSAICVGDTAENPSHTTRLQNMLNQAGLTQKVRLVGHCSDMPAAMLLADVVVSATSTEPEAFGRTAVEAQAMGRPVIASRHGGSLETVVDRRTGWLVTPADPGSMADALDEAIRHKETRRMYGEKGRQWVLDNFTLAEMLEKTIKIYQKLLERPDYPHEKNTHN